MFDFLNGPVRDLVTQIYEAVGYLGVTLWVVIETIFIPIPSEIILPFAGFLAADPGSIEPLTGGRWNVVLLVVFATIGSLVGALIAYALGAWAGRPVLVRWGRYLRFTEDDLARTDAFFERWGNLAAFLGRMVPIVRSLVSFAAGVGRMPLVPFVVFTVLGSIPWNLFLVLAGYLLGENWDAIGAFLKQYEYAVLAILVVVALLWIWFRFVKPRRAVPGPAGR